MRKFSLALLALSMLFVTKMSAQIGGYWFNVSGGTYTELGSPTVVSASTPWDSTANFTIPIGFSFSVESYTTNNVYLHGVNSFCIDTFTHPILNGFQLLNAALIDRGAGSSNSPISYELTGTSGSRILKVQIKNAGFIQELINHSSLNDYVNMQLWLYEGSNVVEIHFGASSIHHAAEYFAYSFGNPMIGHSRRKNMTGDGTLYTVNGVGTSASDLLMNDSATFSSFGVTYLPQGILGFPPDGTIFKFSPLKTNVPLVNVKDAHIYPTACKSGIYVDYNSSENTTFEVISVRGIPTTMKGNLQNGSNYIDLSKIAAGTYVLRLQNSTGSYTQKFVKL